MKNINGFNYSREKFDSHLFRAKLLLVTLKDEEHNLDIYTDNPHRNDTEKVLISRAKNVNNAKSKIIHWASKEQDERTSEFINEILNS